MPIDDIVFGKPIIKAELLNCLAASDAEESQFSAKSLYQLVSDKSVKQARRTFLHPL